MEVVITTTIVLFFVNVTGHPFNTPTVQYRDDIAEFNTIRTVDKINERGK